MAKFTRKHPKYHSQRTEFSVESQGFRRAAFFSSKKELVDFNSTTPRNDQNLTFGQDPSLGRHP